MSAIDNLMVVEMVMSAQDEVNQTWRGLLCEFDITRFAGVRKGYDDIRSLSAQAWYKFLGRLRGRLVYEIRREGVNSTEPCSYK